MSDQVPRIHRPIPRRPFELGFQSPISPEDDSDNDNDNGIDYNYSPPPSPPAPYSFENDQRDGNYLDPNAFNNPINSNSRVGSYQVLTSSTLSGIYSPNISASFDEDDVSATATPRHGKLDDSIYKLVRDRSAVLSRRRSSTVSGKSGQAYQAASKASLALRTGLLFLLGMGYGALLLRLSTDQQWASRSVEEMLRTGYDGKYIAAWGLCGVVLGSLLPWFDGKWEEIFENGQDTDEEAIKEDEIPGTDWALVVRGVGAFAGIVFAIRKVPWASTMQVSLTLAMANPLLWYLIDRSKTGFLLSAAVGLAGTIVSLGLNPEIMPAPTGYSSHRYVDRNATGYAVANDTLMLGGLATQRTIETGIWVISVLFCSCVCFGNIGRRLALNRSAAGRGRWGGLR
ncbi:unnamed protein product [Discula destructiva]